MGPGTHVIDNIFKRIKPTSQPDAVALQHDVDYLFDKEPIISDLRAIVRSDNSLQGMTMKIGLGARSIADYLIHTNPVLNYFDINPTHINGRSDTMSLTDQELNMSLTRAIRDMDLNDTWQFS